MRTKCIFDVVKKDQGFAGLGFLLVLLDETPWALELVGSGDLRFEPLLSCVVVLFTCISNNDSRCVSRNLRIATSGTPWRIPLCSVGSTLSSSQEEWIPISVTSARRSKGGVWMECAAMDWGWVGWLLVCFINGAYLYGGVAGGFGFCISSYSLLILLLDIAVGSVCLGRA